MSRCECCNAAIAAPVVRTIAGEFLTDWGMCRACWHLVSSFMRRAVRSSRLAFMTSPHLEESIAFYRLWTIAVSEATTRRAERRAA